MATPSTALVSKTPDTNPLALKMYGFQDPTSLSFAPGYVGLEIETLTVATVALDGTDATGVSPLTGGVGMRGWLSSIFAGIGTQADGAWASGNGTLVSVAKKIAGLLSGTLAVSGTFWQATQPVSVASLPLPTGAATDTTVAGITTKLAGINTAANTSGGVSTFSAVGGAGASLLTNTAVPVKASAGNLYGFDFINTGSADAYVQIFDLAQGSVTLGTTVPKLAKWVPAGGAWQETFPDEAKISFSAAITVAATTTPTGSTAPATGILANILYK